MKPDATYLEKYREYLRFLALTRLSPRVRVRVAPSDLVQETLLDAHRGWEEFEWRGEEETAAWLRRILAKNLAHAERDHRRARRDVARERVVEKQLAESSLSLGGLIAGRDSTPSHKALRQERVLLLVDALSELDPPEYEALVLQHWHEWSLDAIGEHLGLSRFAVSRLIRRAVSTLKHRLKELE